MAATASRNVGVNENITFFGAYVSPEIRTLGKNLMGIEKHTFRSLVKFIISDFEGKPVSEDTYYKLKQASKQPNIIDVVYSGLYELLTEAYRLPDGILKNDVLKRYLQDLGIPEDFIGDLVGVICGTRRAAIKKYNIENGVCYPKLEDVRWRVDVTISTSSLSRVLEPTILMETTSDEGNVNTFEIQPAQFHKLRFAVASLLKDMEELQKRNILKQPL